MAIIVQKFGGTSVADITCIKNVSKRVKAERDLGNQLVVVVSAMAGVTDQLVGYVNDVSTAGNDERCAEYDTVVSAGEQVTAGLLALTLIEIGIPARSCLGWQLPIRTDDIHSSARIESIDSNFIKSKLDIGEVIVVPGFQGVCDQNRITTLGRGGSDTTAVALAAALKAERCDIYTDVDGVYTSDPRIVPKARKLNKIGYEEMLEMASLGAKVLQTRSVEMGMKHSVPIQVRSSFVGDDGTLLVEEEEVMERRLITGITYSRNDAQITLTKVQNEPGIAAKIFGPLADADINVDMIVQNISEAGDETDMTFTIPKVDLERAVKSLEGAGIKYRSLLTDTEVAKVSVVGVGMRSHSGIAQKMFKTLAENDINILVISTSEIKISVLIKEESLELASRALHTAYDLDGEE
jgi:aspartate kinase